MKNRNTTQKSGILLISHGSPREESNKSFSVLAAKVAARLNSDDVLATYFSIARPNIMDQVGRLVERGITRIVMMPYFLGEGQHVHTDIPAQLEECRQRYPKVEFELLATLQGEPGVEDVITERLMPYIEKESVLPRTGKEIAALSHAIIDRRLEFSDLDKYSKAVARRVIHATADFSFAESLRISPHAIERGRQALDGGAPVICDVNMVKAGMTSVDNEILCAIRSEAVIRASKASKTTRAAAAMEELKDRMNGSVVVIGNAPTALFRVMDIAVRDGIEPALVIGLPVGFVGARESKLALIDSGLNYISNTSYRGGSPVAAAALNALVYLGKDEHD